MLDNAKSREVASVILDPIAKGLLALRLTPSMITVFGAVASITVAISCIANGKFLLAAVLTFLFAGADAVDGTMARISGKQSAWGSFLDSSTDRITDGSIFAALAWWFVIDGQRATAIAALVALVGGFVTSYVRAKAESLNVECKVGIAERPERVGAVLAGMFLTGVGISAALPAFVYLIATLSCVTVVQRFVVVHRALA